MTRKQVAASVGAVIIAIGVFVGAKRAGADPFTTQARLWQPGSPLAASGGRYVFGQVNNMERDQYMLDTKTGRLWRITIYGEEGQLSLMSVVYIVPQKSGVPTMSIAAP